MSPIKRYGLGVIVLSAVAIVVFASSCRNDLQVGETAPTEQEEFAPGETAPENTTRTQDHLAPMEPKLAAGEAAPMESMNAAGEMAPMEAQLASGEMAPMESMNAAGECAAPVEAMLANGSQMPSECQNASGASVMEGMAEAQSQGPPGSVPGAGINLKEEEREDFMREKMTENNDGANRGRAPKGGS